MTSATIHQPHRYQRWSGELHKGRWTWLVIVVTGIRLMLKQGSTRKLVLTGAGIALGTCVILYVLSVLEVLAGTAQARGLYDFVNTVLGVDISRVSRLEEFRGLLWRCVFFLTINIQMFWVLLIVARVGPGLIANDLRFRALPIYFAKPVTPLTYLAGKWMVIAVFVAMVTLLPNLVSLVIGTLVTGGLGTVGAFVDLGLDLFLSAAAICVVSGAIVLALSSMTSDHRYVAVAWLAVCLLPVFAQAVLDESLPEASREGWLGCISLRDNMLIVTDWLFGMRQAWEASSLPAEAFNGALVRPVAPMYAGAVLAGWTAAGILVSYRRVVRFSRSAANV